MATAVEIILRKEGEKDLIPSRRTGNVAQMSLCGHLTCMELGKPSQR